jgi:hypothetical protein
VGRVGAGVHFGAYGGEQFGPCLDGLLPGMFADLFAALGEPGALLRVSCCSNVVIFSITLSSREQSATESSRC